jgi:CRISPR/Cas system-associated protein endoribonuclease Cas2
MSSNSNKNIIPDQLNITILTSIPGYQKIEYKPSMTIKNNSEKSVRFDPLQKLNKQVIDKIPEEYRIKEFFNKELFDSLLLHAGSYKVQTITQATRSGYVDNNIKVTLQTIFPVNSVIYIGKKPYAIGDVQWTTGDWFVELKQKKEEIDVNKVTDPRLYTQLVREEIISGEEQLKQLPEFVLKGDNYSGPPLNVASGIIRQNRAADIEENPIKISTPTSTPTPIVPNKNKQPPVSSSNINPKSIIISNQKSVKPLQLPAPPSETKQEATTLTSSLPEKKQTLALPPSPELSSGIQSPAVEELSPEEERMFDTLNQSFKKSNKSTSDFKNYFLRKAYYMLANQIFLKLNSHNKEKIKYFYQLVTQSNPPKTQNLSQVMYDKLCNQITILESPNNGNCFFQAISDGINIFNYENQANKITYANYGKNQLFTVNTIREIVLRYIEGMGSNYIRDLLAASENNVTELNNKFSIAIQQINPQNEAEYLEKVDYIYNTNDSFLVFKPNTIPIEIDEYDKPFRLLTNGEIPNYIKSKNYWANQIAIKAICNILNIYVIPIEKYKYKGSDKLRTILIDPTDIQNICSKRTLFLYYRDNHYELIRFNYLKQITKEMGVNKALKVITKWYTIFDSNGLPPPFHILILIYGSSYYKMVEEAKSNFGLYPEIMDAINHSVKSNIYNNNFVTLFKSEFPSDKTINNLNLISNSNKAQEIIGGKPAYINNPPYKYPPPPYGYPPYGYPPYGYPPYGYPGYNPRYKKNFIIKKPTDRDASKLAYSITISMELHPGTSLTPEQMKESKCNSKYNAIRKAFSDFTGRPYVIPPVYPKSTTKKASQNTQRREGNIKNVTMKKR